MDICVLNPFFYPYSGGTERVLLEVYSRMARKHNVTVISANLDGGRKDSVGYVKGIRVVRLKTRHIAFPGLPMPFPVMLGLREALQRESAQLYHINNRYLYFFDTINQIKKTSGKIALTLHDSLPKNIGMMTDSWGYFYDVVWGRKIMQYADVITAVSRNTIDTAVPARLRERSYVIYNGVDAKRYRHRLRSNPDVVKAFGELDLDPGSINIMNNGRLVAQKGQVYLLRALAALLRERDAPDANLFIIGRGYLNDTLAYMAKNLRIEKRLRIVSGIGERMMPYYYNAADIFVSSSLYEPASLSVMEALGSEVPVVATRVGGVPEMMGDCGLYMRPRSISGIKERIKEIIKNTATAKKRSGEGRELMLKEHNWDEIAARYEQLFGSVLRN